MSIANKHVEQFFAGVAGIVKGAILRAATSNGIAVMAQANSAGNVTGTIAIARHATALNGVVSGAISGVTEILLVAALTPAVGDTVYVSDATAGRGTNVAPASNAVRIGIITDISKYASLSLVSIVMLSPAAVAPASVPAAILKFSGRITGLASTIGTGISLYDVGHTPNATYFLNAGDAPKYPLARAFTARNLVVKPSVNSFSGTATFTVLRNGVATSITVAVTAGSTARVIDDVNTAALAATDTVQLAVIFSADQTANTLIIAATLELT